MHIHKGEWLGRNHTRVAFAWYQRATWEQLKMVVDDPEQMDESYEAWFKGSVEAFREFRMGGYLVEKIYLTLDEIEAYCLEKGLDNINETRADLATAKLYRKYGS